MKAIELDTKQREFAETHTGEDGKRFLIGLESPAGSGKTQALMGRFMHLCGPPENPAFIGRANRILMMTFTNLARDNAEQRILKHRPELKPRIPEPDEERNAWDPEPLWIGTFHAIAARILRLHLPWLKGRQAPLRILDDSESRQVMTQIMREHPKEFPGAAYASNLYRELKRFRDNETGEAAYQQYLIENDALDFDGLMEETARLFREHPKVKKAWENAFDHVLVDEYQDTDPVQTEILEVLCKNASLAVAGDAAQSIYGWRNAVGSLRALDGIAKRQNRRWHKVHLNTDYRLTRPIQECAERMAQQISAQGKHPHEKPLVSGREGPAPTHNVHDPGQLYDLMEKRLHTHREETGTYRGAAVLCRTNREVAEAAGELGTRGIPVRLAKRDDEVDAIAKTQAWWKLLLTPSSDAAFRLIAEKEGIQGSELAPYAQRAAAGNAAIWEVIPTSTDPGEKLGHLALRARKVYRYYNEREDGAPADPSLQTFFELTGCGREFLDINRDEPQSFESKLCASYRRTCEGVAARKRDIFKTASVMTASTGRLQTHENLREEDFVEIRTMHSAKGLEYHTVLSPNWHEEQFPRSSAGAELEDAMKLAYVTITRSSSRFETFSADRTEYGNELAKSRFIDLMHMKVEDHRASSRSAEQPS